MGVPSFFRWIVQRYSSVIDNVIEALPDTYEANIDGGALPLGFAIDNLYFDTNGLIHPCFHPEGRPQPETEAEVFEEIFQVIDRVVSVCRPRRLLYLAVDGPAPRAKLNQQRSRRFMAAYERQIKQRAQERRHMNLGDTEPSLKKLGFEENKAMDTFTENALDSNAITPGTPFMSRLSVALKYYVANRQANSKLWRHLTVLYADAWSPGEGEHKIMSFVRIQRSQPGYDPCTVHCIYGLDADLIMLALGTHEPNFLILRDVVDTDNLKRTCTRCGHLRVSSEYRTGTVDPFTTRHEDQGGIDCPFYPGSSLRPVAFRSPFQFLHVSRLREYLQREFDAADVVFERSIDDFVFLTFLVGNDFLPHIQCLDIREDAVIRMIYFYKQLKRSKKIGFLTTGSDVNMNDFHILLKELAEQESRIFKARASGKLNTRHSQVSETPNSRDETPGERAIREYFQFFKRDDKRMIKDAMDDYCTLHDKPLPPTVVAVKHILIKYELEKPGYAQRYYLGIGLMDDFQETDQESDIFKTELRKRIQTMCYHYIDGLIWVFRYYFLPKVEDWGWYYPYHHSPLLVDLASASQTYTRTWKQHTMSNRPFNPYEQLLAVMPPASATLLPPVMRCLMTDPASILNKFYPSLIKCDLSEKTALWKGVLLLPFINSSELVSAAQKSYGQLTPLEQQRNRLSDPVVLIHKDHPGFALFKAILDDQPIPSSFSSVVVLDKVEKLGERERKRFYIQKPNRQLNLLAGYYTVSQTDFFKYGSSVAHILAVAHNNNYLVQFCKELEQDAVDARGQLDPYAIKTLYNLEDLSTITNYTIVLRFISPRIPAQWLNATCYRNSAIMRKVVTDSVWRGGIGARERQYSSLIGMSTEKDEEGGATRSTPMPSSASATGVVERARALGF
ncbi:5'-3' exoribonuclease 2 [Giardia lamblia P15]|uniref:5'-3' exoribonuclease 2 n=1 Tax=Giardia intestinalis (strain P15) TaxID=658858 RepID=E1F3C5_GIAIA|nr:5'-3' exoribonuclease 2 [Giardia lamblia P15]